MTDPNSPKSQPKSAPQTGPQGRQRKAEALARQAAALRENLAKRKQQSRSRAETLDNPNAQNGSED